MSRDGRIDAYIARQQSFARPILERIREAFHAAMPDVEEGLRWGMPAFLHQGRILANMAAFKAHVTLGFWNGGKVVEAPAAEKAMGQFGRLTSTGDLPSDEQLHAMILKAAALAGSGRAPRAKTSAKPELELPEDFAAALRAGEGAEVTFSAFSPSARREYIEWVVEAKRPETRTKRIAQAVLWIGEGKRRNWKYEAPR